MEAQDSRNGAAGLTFCDVLVELSYSSGEVIYHELRSAVDLRNARLAAKALRQLVNEHRPELKLTLGKSRAEVDKLCGSSNWLERWPKCTRLTFVVGRADLDKVRLLLASAGSEACSRLKALHIENLYTNSEELSASALAAMLQSVPKLEMLTLEVSMAESSSDQPQEPCAFSQLAHLKHLSLCDYAWVPHIDAAVASRLESVAVDALEGPNKQYDLSKLPAAFAKMATLKSLQLSATAGEACFSPKECRLLLDAAPPFLETLTLHRVEPSEDMSVTVTCTFATGLLACVRLEDQLGFQGATQAQLGAFWARALLPSRKLGPRLPRLILDMILVVDGGEGEVPDAGAAEVLLARCSEVQLGSLNVDAGASVEAVERAARLYGLPARISHHALSVGGVYLRQGDAPPLGASGLKLPSIPLPPAPLPLRPAAVVERVVERLAAAAGTSSEAFNSCVLLRGTYVRELLAHPTARRIWVGGLAWVTNAASNGQGTVEAFWTLPSVGAVVLQCGRGPTGQAVAEVAAEKARGCQVVAEMDPAAAAGLIEALTTGPSVEYSVDRVLQALWDGAEEGGPGPATGSREGELARLRWLLETWEGLRGIMTKMHIAPGA